MGDVHEHYRPASLLWAMYYIYNASLHVRYRPASLLWAMYYIYNASLHVHYRPASLLWAMHMYTIDLHHYMYTIDLHHYMYTIDLHHYMYTIDLHHYMYTIDLHHYYGRCTWHYRPTSSLCALHYWAIQAGLLTPLTFARHRLSPLAAFTSGAYFLHNGRCWQWICEFYTANYKDIFWGPYS